MLYTSNLIVSSVNSISNLPTYWGWTRLKSKECFHIDVWKRLQRLEKKQMVDKVVMTLSVKGVKINLTFEHGFSKSVWWSTYGSVLETNKRTTECMRWPHACFGAIHLCFDFGWELLWDLGRNISCMSFEYDIVLMVWWRRIGVSWILHWIFGGFVWWKRVTYEYP